LAVSTVWTMTQALRPVGGPTQIEENVRQVTRMLMKRDGITLPVLALRLGVSRTAVSNRLGGPAPYSGKKPFTVSEVGVLGEMFGLPAAVFLAGPDILLRAGEGAVSHKKLTQIDHVNSRETVPPLHRRTYGALRLLQPVAA
jgi:transcriptional regulator with XRE-family HTH domain